MSLTSSSGVERSETPSPLVTMPVWAGHRPDSMVELARRRFGDRVVLAPLLKEGALAPEASEAAG